jgi:hypothetical protein
VRRNWTAWEHVVVWAILALHWGLVVSAVRHKSVTSDEVIHLTSGVANWRYGDYRLNPEGGTLTQRLAALPALRTGHRLIPLDSEAWRAAAPLECTLHFFFGGAELPDDLLLASRAVLALLSITLGYAVFRVSRATFGRGGGFVSLVLYASCPTVLANAGLVTADVGSALFFFLASHRLWKLLLRPTIGRALVAALSVTGLLLSKFSGVLIFPILAAMLVLWSARAFRHSHLAGAAAVRSLLLRRGIAIGACSVLTWGLLWAGYGFRFRGAADSTYEFPWNGVLNDSATARVVDFARTNRVLPEAYLFGFQYTWNSAQRRVAFLDGRTSDSGRWDFFPRTLAYKTPLAVLALAGTTGLLALRRGGRARRWWPRAALAPSFVVILVYGVVAIQSDLNIGVRHLLPILPGACVLLGSASSWLGRRDLRGRLGQSLLAVGALEGVWAWPHFLSYFSAAFGGSKSAYRHVVDSSLDWGQDLIGLARWLERNAKPGEQVYLSYFGPSPPHRYGIRAELLPGLPHPLTEGPRQSALRPGLYCLSASMLQGLFLPHPGRWCRTYEKNYRFVRGFLKRYSATASDDKKRREFVAGVLGEAREWLKSNPQTWNAESTIECIEKLPQDYWNEYSEMIETASANLRLARLFAALRQREPDAHVGHSILIYRVPQSDLDRALNEEPPELVDDAADSLARPELLMPPRVSPESLARALAKKTSH